jgi:hypothetical protein
MITSVTIRRFKRFEDVTIPLGETIVLAGPNNSGKTTAIQALGVWQLALARWLDKRGENTKSKAKQRTGVPITRPDMIAVPVRQVRLLWRNCDVLTSTNQPRLIEILVAGSTKGKDWQFGMELQYQGPEMFYCRPMRVSPDTEERMVVPDEIRDLTVFHLPPLAGLQLREERVDERVLQTRISEGRAGDVIRNLLYLVAWRSIDDWERLAGHVRDLFQVEVIAPVYMPTGEIVCEYYSGLPGRGGRNPNPRLDVASGGSGFHQVLLLLAFLYAMPGSVLLFDEPDAHLEVIRQRDVYKLLQKVAAERQAQLIVASHSEVILDETIHENIIAFVGEPHRLLSSQQKSQLRKSLSEIPSADYLLAEQRGAFLYVEDYTDVDILHAWATVLAHPAGAFLDSPLVVYIGNVPRKAREHFHGLQSAYPNLQGVMLIDQTDIPLVEAGGLREVMWNRREIENYLLVPEAILRFCQQELQRLYHHPEEDQGQLTIWEAVISDQLSAARELLHRFVLPDVSDRPLEDGPFAVGTKVSDVVLEPFFRAFYSQIGEYNTMPKTKFYRLAAGMLPEEIHTEVRSKLDAIATLVPATP